MWGLGRVSSPRWWDAWRWRGVRTGWALVVLIHGHWVSFYPVSGLGGTLGRSEDGASRVDGAGSEEARRHQAAPSGARGDFTPGDDQHRYATSVVCAVLVGMSSVLSVLVLTLLLQCCYLPISPQCNTPLSKLAISLKICGHEMTSNRSPHLA